MKKLFTAGIGILIFVWLVQPMWSQDAESEREVTEVVEPAAEVAEVAEVAEGTPAAEVAGTAEGTPVAEAAGTAEVTDAATAPEVAEIPPLASPDAEGVIPSLVLKAEIADFLKMIGSAYQKNIIPSRQVRGVVNVNLFNVTFREALDAVLKANDFAYEEQGAFIYVYTQKEFAQLQAAARKTETRVFQLNYISALDVKTLIDSLLSDDGKITVSPDAGSHEENPGENWALNNYIVVVDYPERLDEIGKLVAKIDARPPQVLVEATILVASVSDENKLGVDFNVLDGLDFSVGTVENGGVGTITEPADTNARLSGTKGQYSTGADGLKIGIFSTKMELMIEALETITDVVTLGNPKVLTINRQMGKVLVGNSDGYVTTEVSQTTTTQTVQFLDTGTELTFRPFVMDDGYIRMDLFTKDSDGGVEVSGTFTLPSESTAEVTSNVLVKDGHTIVIGGLFREKTSITRAQVPVLGNLPVVGALFRETTDDAGKEEVIFMITPHIVQEKIDYAKADQVLTDIQQKMMGFREGMLWYGRDRLSSAHYQWALQNQEKGKRDMALWNATLASYMNPGFLDAKQLKDELQSDALYEEQYGPMNQFIRNMLEMQMGADASPEDASSSL